MDLALYAKQKLKELRAIKLEIHRAKKKVPNELLKEMKYHREVIALASKYSIEKQLDY